MKLAHHRIDRRALDAEQASEGFLGQLDPVAGAVLRVKQPARGAFGIEWKALHATDCITCDEQIVREAAEQIAR